MRIMPFSLTVLAIATWPMLAPADTGAGAGAIQPQPIGQDSLKNLRWNARPVVVLGSGAAVDAQLNTLRADPKALTDRDIAILIDGPGAQPLRERAGDGFAVLLIGKDGGIKQIWSEPVNPQVIFDLIDAMPMRQREAAQED